MLEGGEFAHCLLLRIDSVSEKNIPYLSTFLHGGTIHFEHNSSTQLNRRNTCISWKHTVCASSRRVLCKLLKLELGKFLKGVQPNSQGFPEGKLLILCKIPIVS
jgi:hypothetical protein